LPFQSSPSPLWGGIKGGVDDARYAWRDAPTLLDLTDLADAKSYLVSLPTRGRETIEPMAQ